MKKIKYLALLIFLITSEFTAHSQSRSQTLYYSGTSQGFKVSAEVEIISTMGDFSSGRGCIKIELVDYRILSIKVDGVTYNSSDYFPDIEMSDGSYGGVYEGFSIPYSSNANVKIKFEAANVPYDIYTVQHFSKIRAKGDCAFFKLDNNNNNNTSNKEIWKYAVIGNHEIIGLEGVQELAFKIRNYLKVKNKKEAKEKKEKEEKESSENKKNIDKEDNDDDKKSEKKENEEKEDEDEQEKSTPNYYVEYLSQGDLAAQSNLHSKAMSYYQKAKRFAKYQFEIDKVNSRINALQNKMTTDAAKEALVEAATDDVGWGDFKGHINIGLGFNYSKITHASSKIGDNPDDIAFNGNMQFIYNANLSKNIALEAGGVFETQIGFGYQYPKSNASLDISYFDIPIHAGISFFGNVTLMYIQEWTKIRYKYSSFSTKSSSFTSEPESFINSRGIGIAVGNYDLKHNFFRITGMYTWSGDELSENTLKRPYARNLRIMVDFRISRFYYGLFYTHNHIADNSKVGQGLYRIGVRLGFGFPF